MTDVDQCVRVTASSSHSLVEQSNTPVHQKQPLSTAADAVRRAEEAPDTKQCNPTNTDTMVNLAEEAPSSFALGPASFHSVSPSSSSSGSSSSTPSSSSNSSSSSSSPRQQRHAAPSLSQDWLNGAKTATAGGIAGAFAKSCTAPLARLTILYQVQGFQGAAAAGGGHTAAAAPPGMRQAFMQVVRQEGPAALWKGNLVTILHRLPYSSINFYTYERTQKLLEHNLPSATNFARAWMSGATAGLVACSAAYPLDLVRTRLAAQTHGHYYSGIWSTLRCIVKDEGALGLYRGLGATLLQVVPSLALNFSLYDSIRNSCMAVHLRMQRLRRQKQMAAVVDAVAAEARGSSSGSSASGSSSSKSRGLAVASTVDQGTSYQQMLLWHLDDARDAAEAYAASSDGNRSSSSSSGSSSWWRWRGSSSESWEDVAAAAAAATLPEEAFEERRESHTAASSSGSTHGSSPHMNLDTSSSSSSSSGVRVGRHADVPAGISLASGCVSGFLTATATFPLDVVRRRMQVYGRQHQGQPVSYRQIIQEITSSRGLRGFYVGILPEYCKVVPGVAIAFCTYEQLKQWLHVER